MDSNENYVRCKFGNCYGSRLINKEIKDSILNKLERYYRIKLYVPFGKLSTDVSLSSTELKDVVQYDHLVNYLIDSPLVYLYLTKYNDISLCYYIFGTSRTNCEIYSTVQRFDSSLFDSDILFEGYSLGSGSNTVFLVEDIIVYQGSTVKQYLEERIKIINRILDYHYQPDPVLDTHRVMLKDYVEYSYLQSLMTDYLTTLSYKSNIKGLIFSPLGNCVNHLHVHLVSCGPEDSTSLVSDKDNERFEIVSSPKKTKACFLVKATGKPDVYHLYLRSGRGNQTKYYDFAAVPDRESSAKLKELINRKEGRLMVCKYDDRPHMKRWQPIMVSGRSEPDTIYKIKGI